MHFGVIAPAGRSAAARTAGVDYVEPTVINNLLAWPTGSASLPEPDEAAAPHPSFAVLFPGSLVLSDPRADREEITAYIEAALDALARVAAPGARIVFGSGAARRLPDDVEPSTARHRFAEVVREVRDAARERDLVVVLEPLNRGETNFLHSIVEVADFLDEHGIDGVPIVADFYHMQLEGEGLDVLASHGHRIGHAHVADSGRVAVGDGDWPCEEFVRALRACGYGGNLSLECAWDDFVAEVSRSLAVLRAA